MKNEPLSDDELKTLLLLAMKRDNGAYERVFPYCFNFLVWFLMRKFGLQKSDAEDCAQTAMVKIFASLAAGKYRPEKALQARALRWISRQGEWVGKDFLRRERARKATPMDIVSEGEFAMQETLSMSCAVWSCMQRLPRIEFLALEGKHV